MKILFLSPEALPYAKTGGLADVAAALPRFLKKLGCETRIFLPFYRTVKESTSNFSLAIKDLEVPLGNAVLKCDILETEDSHGMKAYLLKREDLYDRPNLYGDSKGDYYDNLERFSFFCRAGLLFLKKIGFQPDILHCHDWQTGLVPVYLKGLFHHSPFHSAMATVFTIHNIGYQGLFPAEKFAMTGLPWSFYTPEGLEYWGNVSLLKSGIVFADALTTVSPSYGKEILTAEYGLGMEGILANRSDVLHGILNGVDESIWNPEKDPDIPAAYGLGRMKGKSLCKRELIRESGLDLALLARPLLGMISRLTRHKGCELLLKAMDDIMALDIGLIILGMGEEDLQAGFEQSARRYPGRIRVTIGFDEALARRILAGSDILLIPSRYEPCGQTQMFAMKYGTIPLARATGGLNDTIMHFDPRRGEGTGFKFRRYDPKALIEQIRFALRVYSDQRIWHKLVLNALKADFSWDRSARQYLAIYQDILR